MTAPGVYRAVVANNVDPEGLSRLKVVIPAIAAESESGWCWPVVPAWNWPLPAVGDPVWIMFEAANEGYPVWIGTWVRLQDVYETAAVPGGTSPGRPPVEFGGGSGGGTGTNEVWVGTSDPIGANPTIELWVDTDAFPGQQLWSPQPIMRLQLTASQVVAAATTAVCSWTESANSDPQGIITLPLPTRIMVNRTGHYLLSYIHRWGTMIHPASGSSEVKINAGDVVAGGTRLFIGQTIPGTDVTGARIGSTSKVIHLTVGDYLNIFVNHTEPVNSRTLDGGAGGEAHTSCQLMALVGAKGDPGPQGPVGPGAPVTNYTHIQGTPSATWVVVHNLGFYPSTAAEDSANNDIEGEIAHNSINQLTITFSAAIAGRSYHS